MKDEKFNQKPATGTLVEIPLSAGRTAFGASPQGYEAARPEYPPQVFEWLSALGVESGRKFFEVGPGTGSATRLLLRLEPAHLTAIEPDERMAGFLYQEFAGAANLHVVHSGFEEAALDDAAFDLGAAATSFHWLEQEAALARVHKLLRPGGWWCMWWNVFGDQEHPDAFEQASTPLFRQLTPTPSWTCDGRLPFALDEQARRAQMAAAGLRRIEFHRLHWTLAMQTAQVLGLAATFSQVSLAEPERRAWFLDALGELVEREFGGSVERHFSTVFYAGQRPD